jgi:phage-related protein
LDSAEAIDRLSKFLRRGEIAFADGIIEIGNINVEYQEYARQVGKSVMQLTQEERARVRLNIVMEEGRKSLGAYASTMQTSGKAVLSVGNVVKDIYGMLGSYLEPIFASITLSVFNFVSSVRTALISNAQTFQDWAVKVAGYVVAVVRVIGTYLTAIPVIGKYFEGLSKFSLQPIAVTMGAIEDSTKGISKGIDKATGSAKKLRKELAGFDEMTVLKGEEEAGGGLGGVVGGVETGIGKIFDLEAMNEQISQVNKIADSVQSDVQKKVDNIVKIVRVAVVAIGLLIGVLLVGKVIGAIGTISKVIGLLAANPQMLIIIAIIAVIAGLAYVIIKNWEPISAFFEGLWEDISNWFVTAWNNIKGVAESVADWFVEKYEGVKNWIAFKIFEVQYLFIFLGNAISNIWETIKNTIIEKFTIVKNWIGGAIGSINGFFSSIWNTVVNVFTNVGNFIWDKMSWVVNKVGDKIEEMKNGMKKFFGGVVDSIKAPINWIIDNINDKLISPLRNFKIPGILPNGINIAKIQRLATGGIIESPTMAVIGEAGREAVLPLDRNTEWIDLLASKINSRGGGEPINIVVKIGDDKVGEKVIDYINEKGLRTGSTLLNI